jgi:hypothetical protein
MSFIPLSRLGEGWSVPDSPLSVYGEGPGVGLAVLLPFAFSPWERQQAVWQLKALGGFVPPDVGAPPP